MIRYSGLTLINETFVAATRLALVEGITDALTAPVDGWSVVSGSAGDRILESRQTPHGLKGRIRIWDPGSGNCCRIGIQNVGGTVVLESQPIYLLPGGEEWRVLGCGYQAGILSSTIASRKFGMFGVPYLEDPPLAGVITECMWAHGSAQHDTDSTMKGGFRTSMNIQETNCSMQIVNGSGWSFASGGSYPGLQRLLALNTRWHGGEYAINDPLIEWGLTAQSERRYRGQLWDCAVFSEMFNFDETDITYAGKLWYSITGNSSSGSLCHIRGSAT